MKQEKTSKKRYIAMLAIVAVLVLVISVLTPTIAYYIRTAGSVTSGPHKPGQTQTPDFDYDYEEANPQIRLFAANDGTDEEHVRVKKNLVISVTDEGYPLYVRVALIVTWRRLALCECEGCEIAPKGCEKCKEDCTDCLDCEECTDDCEKCKIYPKCDGCEDDCIDCSNCENCEEDCARCKLSIDCCSHCEQCQEACMPKDEGNQENVPSTQDDGDTESDGSEEDTETEEETEPPYCARCNGEVDVHFTLPKLGVDYTLDINEKKQDSNGNETDVWFHNVDGDGNVTKGYDGFYYYAQPLISTAQPSERQAMQTPIFITKCELINPVEPKPDGSGQEGGGSAGTEGNTDNGDNNTDNSGDNSGEGTEDNNGEEADNDESTWPGEGWYLNIEVIVQTVQAIGFTDIGNNPAWKDAWPDAPWKDNVWGKR